MGTPDIDSRRGGGGVSGPASEIESTLVGDHQAVPGGSAYKKRQSQQGKLPVSGHHAIVCMHAGQREKEHGARPLEDVGLLITTLDIDFHRSVGDLTT